MVFASTLIWYHPHQQRCTRKTGTDMLTHLHICHLLCTHSSFLYYTDWITCWYRNLLHRSQQCFFDIECFWWNNFVEMPAKKKTEKCWSHLFSCMDFIWTKVRVHPLGNKFRWSKWVSFRSYNQRTKLSAIW